MNEKVVIEMTFDEYEEYKKQKKIEEYSVEELVEILLRKKEIETEERFSVALQRPTSIVGVYNGKDCRFTISVTKN